MCHRSCPGHGLVPGFSGLEVGGHCWDLVSPEHHVLAGKAKDIAAAGVMISALTAVIVFGILIYDEIG